MTILGTIFGMSQTVMVFDVNLNFDSTMNLSSVNCLNNGVYLVHELKIGAKPDKIKKAVTRNLSVVENPNEFYLDHGYFSHVDTTESIWGDEVVISYSFGHIEDTIFYSGNWSVIEVKNGKFDTLECVKETGLSDTIQHTIFKKNRIAYEAIYIKGELRLDTYYSWPRSKIEMTNTYNSDKEIITATYFYRSGKIEAILDFKHKYYKAFKRNGDSTQTKYIVLGNCRDQPVVITQ